MVIRISTDFLPETASRRPDTPSDVTDVMMKGRQSRFLGPLVKCRREFRTCYAVATVRKRPLGKTGLIVSELALGTWGVSGDAYGKVAPEDAERLVARALDLGFSLFETSDAYGGGKMEELLGRLPGTKEAILVTKGGIDRKTEPPSKSFEPSFLRGAIERSLKRLGRDRIDVYLLHNPSPDALASGHASELMGDLKKEGKIAHWGVSAGDTDVARAALTKGAEVLELAYNIFQAIDLHRLAGEIMVAGAGVLARSTLAYGLLSGFWSKEREFPEGDHRRDRWTKAELAQRVEQLDAVRYLVKGDILTMRGAAVRFVLANHLVSAAVLGPKSVEQLEQLVREVGSGPNYLPDPDLAALPRALSRVGIST
jgi:aryl-alcohol dehydrogenase-like predicted oxidoreductase